MEQGVLSGFKMTLPDLACTRIHSFADMIDSSLEKRRFLLMKVATISGFLCVAALWSFEARADLIADFDRYAYPALMVLFAATLALAIRLPRHRRTVELGCYIGVSLYFVGALGTFSLLQQDNRIYTIANTLQWMPILYVCAFAFFEKTRAVVAAVTIFLLSLLPPLLVLTLEGPAFWNAELGALLINAYLVHAMILALMSVFTLLHNRLTQTSALAISMQETANTDFLTGIANRRGLEAALEAADPTPKHPLALILFDIDHFKAFNDRHGHLAGDAALKEVADLAVSQLRAGDVIGRWGGEEFLMITRDTDSAAALCLAERVRRTVDAQCFVGRERLSVSAGVAAWDGQQCLADVLAAADLSLYEAKRRGRNCSAALKPREAVLAK